MKEPALPSRVRQKTYPSAAAGVADSRKHVRTEQTQSPSYGLAFADDDFLLRDEMRGVRLQLEFQKADLLQREAGIQSTIVVFGGARVRERTRAEDLLHQAESALSAEPDNPALQARLARARQLLVSSRYYDEARELARLASTTCQIGGECHFVIATGGGPGIMEAANRGAHEAGAKTIGLNIVLPEEQAPNHYITPELCFQFHYFALRKMHFLMRAKALVCFPGGFGTMDELFEALTIIQTGKIEPIPVLLVGKEHWEKAVDFEFLASEGFVAPEDIRLVEMVETGREAWDAICRFYSIGVA